MAEPTFKRSKAAEEAAIERGTATREQIEARGGINVSGYYGDSYQEGRTLTDEEYAAALSGAKAAGKTGAGLGAAVNAASLAKLKTYYESQGYTPEEIAGLTEGTLTISPSGSIISTGSSNLSASGNTSASNVDNSERQSAYDLLYQQFQQYGLGALVEPLKKLIETGVSPAEFTIQLRETDAYKKRFAANASRIAKGLRALSEAEYIGLEDQYQDVMRRYGLPDTYYTRGEMGRQEGFEKFIGGDVSPVELEDRIQTAQKRVINANPEVAATLRSFYPEIGNGDLLAYFLDPDKAVENIRRKVTAAEIGGAATMSGLATGMKRAEELAGYGVTKEAAQQGFQTIADILPRGSQLAEIYKQSPYSQTTAEQEVFGLAGATEAGKQRKKLTQLEQASFSGSSGLTGGALGRERAGSF